jgi:hypothetical protein
VAGEFADRDLRTVDSDGTDRHVHARAIRQRASTLGALSSTRPIRLTILFTTHQMGFIGEMHAGQSAAPRSDIVVLAQHEYR